MIKTDESFKSIAHLDKVSCKKTSVLDDGVNIAELTVPRAYYPRHKQYSKKVVTNIRK